MENASKALIIAAGVFMGIIIMTIGVYLFVNYRNIAENYDKQMEGQTVEDKIEKLYIEIASSKNEKITLAQFIKFVQEQNELNEKIATYKMQITLNLGTADTYTNSYEKIKGVITKPDYIKDPHTGKGYTWTWNEVTDATGKKIGNEKILSELINIWNLAGYNRLERVSCTDSGVYEIEYKIQNKGTGGGFGNNAYGYYQY